MIGKRTQLQISASISAESSAISVSPAGLTPALGDSTMAAMVPRVKLVSVNFTEICDLTLHQLVRNLVFSGPKSIEVVSSPILSSRVSQGELLVDKPPGTMSPRKND